MQCKNVGGLLSETMQCVLYLYRHISVCHDKELWFQLIMSFHKGLSYKYDAVYITFKDTLQNNRNTVIIYFKILPQF